MWAWKHLALLAGILGVCAIFAPMFEVQHGRVAVEFSARQLSFGLDRPHSLLERDLPRAADKYLPDALRDARDEGRLIARASRWAALAYAPAALLLVVGLLGVLRRRFGRALGVVALLLGLASIAAWIGLRFGIRFALDHSDLKRTEVSLLFGAHLLLVVGAAGVVAGIGAIARPDLGPAGAGAAGAGVGARAARTAGAAAGVRAAARAAAGLRAAAGPAAADAAARCSVTGARRAGRAPATRPAADRARGP